MTHTGDGGERDLDKRLASGVRVVPLAPEATGFNAWSRKEEPHRSALPHPRRVPEPEPKPESEPVPDPAPEPVPALSPGGGPIVSSDSCKAESGQTLTFGKID